LSAKRLSAKRLVGETSAHHETQIYTVPVCTSQSCKTATVTRS